MTDEGAKGQAVAEPPVYAPLAPQAAGDATPAFAGLEQGSDASQSPPEANLEPVLAPAADAPEATPSSPAAARAESGDAAAGATSAPVVEAAPQQVLPTTSVAAAPPPTVSPPAAARPRDWAKLEFAGWRLLELAATVAAAVVLVGLFLPGGTFGDIGLLSERLLVTGPLLVMTLLVGGLVGLPLGYLAARAGSWPDVVVRGFATVGGSLSPVWLSMLLVLLFAVILGWLQPGGFVPWGQSPSGALTSLVLPALGLGLPVAAELALRFRDALRSFIHGPVIGTAQTMGMTATAAIHSHGLRAALAETSAGMALPLALLVPASLIIENVFYLPGLGRFVFSALETGDAATLRAGLVAVVTLVALTRMLALVLQALADPRIARRP